MSRPYLSSESGHHSQESLNAPSYALSQLQDDYTCQKTLYEFLQEFAEEEKAQDVGEQARSTEFDEMMAGFTEVFETDQQRQERLFLEADARQEETFQKREPLREAVFFEGQISRAAAFEVEQTSRAKRSEWHSAAREMLLVQGRQGRKDACTAVDAALVQQFDKLLKVQEDSFSSAESRRDGIVQNWTTAKIPIPIHQRTLVSLLAYLPYLSVHPGYSLDR
ncbi:hypothetical protein FPV67DRAFT_242162 [Lyophyllum atratum]|nr:hypothetical protein FPV67DRAFT_242162 [Lyophyllum atratum]